jgi:hypothetical protein
VDGPGGGFVPILEVPMRKILLAALLSTVTAGVFAQEAKKTCTVQATDKKLAGAALNSFMKKCKRDARTACEADAAEKKYFGAARTSHVTKCVKDAVGP